MVVDPNYLNLMRNILITFIFFFFLTQNIQAEQRDDELNSLFEKLKISNQSEVKEITKNLALVFLNAFDKLPLFCFTKSK